MKKMEIENVVLDKIEKMRDEIIKFHQEIVKIPSENPPSIAKSKIDTNDESKLNKIIVFL